MQTADLSAVDVSILEKAKAKGSWQEHESCLRSITLKSIKVQPYERIGEFKNIRFGWFKVVNTSIA